MMQYLEESWFCEISYCFSSLVLSPHTQLLKIKNPVGELPPPIRILFSQSFSIISELFWYQPHDR